MQTTNPLVFERGKWVKNAIIVFCLVFFSAFPFYKNTMNGLGKLAYKRHMEYLSGDMTFYNPWKYRALCPYLIEAGYFVYKSALGRTLDYAGRFMEKLRSDGETSEVLGYFIVFAALRFTLHLLIFYTFVIFAGHFVRNPWLILAGLVFIVYSFGHSVLYSDYSYNNYMEVWLYLLAGIVIVKGYNPYWIILITIFAAFNRETSILLPFLFFVSQSRWRPFKLPSTKIFAITGISYLFFFSIFFGLRWYFGYRDPVLWLGTPGIEAFVANFKGEILILNYFEILGTVCILPFICLYFFKSASEILRVFFLAIVPIWFIGHLSIVVGYESRVFLVPTVLIFLPMALEIVEKQLERFYLRETQLD